MRKLFALVAVLLMAAGAGADLYWVSPTGAATWVNGKSEIPLAGTDATTLAIANANDMAGDTVYLRGGTYSLTAVAISPTNSGTSSSARISYLAYNSESVIFSGVSGYAGRNAAMLSLDSDSFIVVSGITAVNISSAFLIGGSSTKNEISYCDLSFRDYWNDIALTGTAKNDADHNFQSASVLYDNAQDMTAGLYKRVFNRTDKSTSVQSGASTSTTVTSTSYPLTGGTNNYWSNGDVYEITVTYPYDHNPCHIHENSTHNYIHHNTIHGAGGFLENQDGIMLLNIGGDIGTLELNSNNTVEFNHFYNAGHHVVGINKGINNVIRNNYMHNEAWFSDENYSGNCFDNGLCGYRVLVSVIADPDYGGKNLFEDNYIAFGDQYGGPHLATGGSGSATTLSSPKNLYRYNYHYGNAMFGIRIGSSIEGPNDSNFVYNNTFYSNGWRVGVDPDVLDYYRSGIIFYGDGVYGNVIKNNLFFKHWAQSNYLSATSYYPSIIGGLNASQVTANLAGNTITNNYGNTNSGTYWTSPTPLAESADPLFTDTLIPANSSQIISAWSGYSVISPILTIKASSPAIDGGTFLTQANGAGTNATKICVDESKYFQDSSWGSDLARSGLHSDWISIGTVGNTAQIVAVDYATDTLTLAAAKSWDDNANIWLYKKSDGTVVLRGNAPDYGANEYIPPTRKTATIILIGRGD